MLNRYLLNNLMYRRYYCSTFREITSKINKEQICIFISVLVSFSGMPCSSIVKP